MNLDIHSGKRKFAYIPTKTYSGKRIWCQYYIRATAGKIIHLGESRMAFRSEYRRFTESEWSMELLKK